MTGARAGRAIEHRERYDRDVETILEVEDSSRPAAKGDGWTESRGVQEPRHVRTHCAGTWEVCALPHGRSGAAKERRSP